MGTLDIVLGDEAALHSIWCNKGSSGVKCCPVCRNICSDNWQGSELLGPGTFLQDYSTIVSLDQCVHHTKESIVTLLQLLDFSKPPRMTKGDFEERERRLGWNHTPFNLLHDVNLGPLLDPTEQTVFDWAHNALQGCFQVTIYLSMKDISPSLGPSHVFAWLQQVTWPRRVGSKCASGIEMFCPKRVGSSWEAENWKCSQSEALSIYAVLANYFREVIRPLNKHSSTCEAVTTLSTLIHML